VLNHRWERARVGIGATAEKEDRVQQTPHQTWHPDITASAGGEGKCKPVTCDRSERSKRRGKIWVTWEQIR
jgi:hypothetical protein